MDMSVGARVLWKATPKLLKVYSKSLGISTLGGTQTILKIYGKTGTAPGFTAEGPSSWYVREPGADNNVL